MLCHKTISIFIINYTQLRKNGFIIDRYIYCLHQVSECDSQHLPVCLSACLHACPTVHLCISKITGKGFEQI